MYVHTNAIIMMRCFVTAQLLCNPRCISGQEGHCTDVA